MKIKTYSSIILSGLLLSSPDPLKAGDNVVTKVVVDSDNNVILTGSSNNSTGERDDYYTTKYNGATGAVLWAKRWKGGAAKDDVPTDLAVSDDDDVVVTGWTVNSTGYTDFYTIKYSGSDGTVLWNKRYDGAYGHSDAASGLGIGSSGNVYVVGTSAVEDAGFGMDIPALKLLKYDGTDGTVLFDKTDLSAYEGADIVVHPTWGVLVTGGIYAGNTGEWHSYTAKFSSGGQKIWGHGFDRNISAAGTSIGPGWDFGNSLAVGPNGQVITTGYIQDYTYDDTVGRAAHTVKLDNNGFLLWQARDLDEVPSSHIEDEGLAVAVDASGCVFVAGRIAASGGTQFLVAKYAADGGGYLPNLGRAGVLLWQRRIANEGNQYDEARAIALDSAGNVVATGKRFNTATQHFDYYTVKYTSGGTLLWSKQFDSGAHLHDQAVSVAVDGNNDVIVTGNSENSAGVLEFYTAKYNGSTGTLIWARRF